MFKSFDSEYPNWYKVTTHVFSLLVKLLILHLSRVLSKNTKQSSMWFSTSALVQNQYLTLQTIDMLVYVHIYTRF
jgi:hypothetical protein